MKALALPVLAAVTLVPHLLPAQATAPSSADIDWRGALEAVDSVTRTVMTASKIPGAVVVLVEGDRVRLMKGYGVADVATRQPVDPHRTIFRIGSISKALTALGVLRLVDERRLSLDDPVQQFLPASILLGRFTEPVRVRHLLTHSAGFDQVGLRRQVPDPSARPALEQFLARELVQVRHPGIVAVYDTYGITLAGHLIERVSNRTYADYMRSEVFTRLGMRDTWVETPSAQRGRLAHGYGLQNDSLIHQTYEWYVTTPASSVDATAADMAQLLVAMLNGGANSHGRLLGEAMAERVLTQQFPVPGPHSSPFAWGWFDEQRAGYRALHHGGVMRGYSSELYMVPEARIGLYVAYNRDPETGPDPALRERLVDLLYARVLPPRSQPSAVLSAPASIVTARFAGAYAFTLGCFTCHAGEGWGLSTIQFRASEPGVISDPQGRRWFAVDSTKFRGEVSGAAVEFVADPAGRVRYMVQGVNSAARLDEQLLDEVLGSDWRTKPPAPLVALVYRANEQWADAARAYASLTTRFPSNGAYPFYHGFSLLHSQRFAEARPAFEEAIRRQRWIPWSRYYVASSYAGMRDTVAALSTLRAAVAAGFNDRNLLMTEPWWEPYRSLSDWQAIVQEIRR